MELNPTLAWVLIGIGAILVLIASFADPLGLEKSAGFGWRQGLAVVIGAQISCGLLLCPALARRGEAAL